MKTLISTLLLVLTTVSSTIALADCEVVVDGKKTPYTGGSLQNLVVEKKSLIKLDRQFPKLNVVEKTFKGEVITCSNCSDNYLVCNN